MTVISTDQNTNLQRNKQMKLLDVLKKYDRCVVRESAKLTKIYKTLLQESEEVDDIDEAACPDCGNDPCTCEDEDADKETGVGEAEEMMTAKEFFGEAEKAKKAEKCDESEDEEVEESDDDETNESEDEETDEAEEMMSAEEFFAECDTEDGQSVEESDSCDESEDDDIEESDDAGAGGKETDEAEEMISAEEFFGESDDKKCKGKKCDESKDDGTEESGKAKADESEDEKTDEAEEMMTAEEFFSESDDDDEKCDESEDEEVKESDGDEADESEDEEKKLQESLKSYRRANHRLFNA